MNQVFILGLVVLHFLNTAPLRALDFRGGSDGPTPFTKISAPEKMLIPIKRPFSSFAYLEGKQTIAYTDSEKRLRLFDLATGTEFDIGMFQGKLFPVVDPLGRVLLSDNLTDIKVVQGKSGFKDLRLPVSQQFGFWSEGKLWMIKSLRLISGDKWQLSFFSYSPDLNQVSHKTCRVQLKGASSSVQLSSQHPAPYFSLYSFDTKQNPSSINTYLVNPKSQRGVCQIESQDLWKEDFDGAIQSASLVHRNQEVLIFTDGTEKNLYYSRKKEIFGAKLPTGSPWLLNPNSLVLVNLTAKRGIDIYSLETEKYFTINMVADRFLLAERQIWVDSSGEFLFLSAPIRRGKTSERLLYMMSLKRLNE